jgi:hypothetical protein
VSDIDYSIRLRTLDGGPGIERGAAWLPPLGPDQRDSWGLLFRDFDNDGHEDLIVPFGAVDPLRRDPLEQMPALFRWAGERFEDETDSLPLPAHLWWRAALPADLDGDGALDVVMTTLFGQSVLLRGRPQTGSWLEVALDGGGPNSAGLGARVTFEWGERRREFVLGVGEGYASSLEPIARIGLGDVEAADVHVDWPDGASVSLDGVPARQRLVIPHP